MEGKHQATISSNGSVAWTQEMGTALTWSTKKMPHPQQLCFTAALWVIIIQASVSSFLVTLFKWESFVFFLTGGQNQLPLASSRWCRNLWAARGCFPELFEGANVDLLPCSSSSGSFVDVAGKDILPYGECYVQNNVNWIQPKYFIQNVAFCWIN